MIQYFKRLIRNYFGFSGNQITGFLVLVPLMFLIIFSVPAYRYWMAKTEPDFSADVAFLDSLVFVSNAPADQHLKSDRAILYTRFNPNEIGAKDFIQLGFPETVAKRILHYREKGGVFRVKSDLAKIYGLTPELFRKVQPFIALPEHIEKKDPIFKKPRTKEYTKKVVEPFNLNTADTAQLKTIYGIGEVLSVRIIKYRNQLGGFIHENQLKEVYHLDSATITRLREHTFIEENFQPEKININLVSESELSKHPYITYKQAKAIVHYRFQHGKFSDVEELNKIVGMNSGGWEKINRYLIIE